MSIDTNRSCSEPLAITVVIPALNEEDTISRCLVSIEKQDYGSRYEIIVVDNGSTDNTAAIAERHGVKVVHCHKPGVTRARAAGAREASGNLIVQADADTVYPSNWLSNIARHFAADSGLIALAGEVTYEGAPLWARVSHLFRQMTNRMAWRFLSRPATILACNFAVRKEALEGSGGYNTGLPHVGDEHDLLRRLTRIGPIVYDRTITARTSSRRFNGRFWQFLLMDLFLHTFLAQVLFRCFKREMPFHRPVLRREYMKVRFSLRRAISLAMLVAVVGFLSYGYFYPPAQVFGKTYSKLNTGRHIPYFSQGVSTERVIALTFDDGPNAPYTSQVLDVLKDYKISATFFVIGANVERYPSTVQRIVAEGHVVGNHSYSHKATSDLTEWSYVEFDKTQEVIYRTVGLHPALFRPPYGQKTPWQLAYVRKRKAATVLWSVSVNDPRAESAQTIAKAVVARTKPGSIILLHDGNGTADGFDRSKTVEALPAIIEELQARGYRFVTVPELLGLRPYL